MGNVGIEVLIVLGIIVLIGGIGIAVYLHERKRTAQFQRIAAELSFEFFGDNDRGLLAHLADFTLFSQGRSRKMKNLMQGTSSETAVSIFDYRYTVGSGKNSSTHKQTVICFQSDRLNLPNFVLRPERWYHKIGSMFGYQDINFGDFPEFSRKYLLRGDNEQGVRDLFTADVVDFFEQLDGVCAEGHVGKLVVYRAGKRAKPADVRAFLKECFGVFSELTHSTTEELTSAEGDVSGIK